MVFARFVSIVFHPLLLTTYLFVLFAYTFPVALEPVREDQVRIFIFLIFAVTFILPVLNIGLFKTTGTISSFSMPGRKERILPFLFIAILYCALTYLFYDKVKVGLHDNFLRFLIIIDLLVIMSTLVTLLYRVSIHSLSACGMLGILLPLNKVVESGDLLYPTVIAIALSGLIMSARLKLNAHTPREVLVGAILGFSTSFIAMQLLF